jgi:hypothetical protein
MRRVKEKVWGGEMHVGVLLVWTQMMTSFEKMKGKESGGRTSFFFCQ